MKSTNSQRNQSAFENLNSENTIFLERVSENLRSKLEANIAADGSHDASIKDEVMGLAKEEPMLPDECDGNEKAMSALPFYFRCAFIINSKLILNAYRTERGYLQIRKPH